MGGGAEERLWHGSEACRGINSERDEDHVFLL